MNIKNLPYVVMMEICSSPEQFRYDISIEISELFLLVTYILIYMDVLKSLLAGRFIRLVANKPIEFIGLTGTIATIGMRSRY